MIGDSTTWTWSHSQPQLPHHDHSHHHISLWWFNPWSRGTCINPWSRGTCITGNRTLTWPRDADLSAVSGGLVSAWPVQVRHRSHQRDHTPHQPSIRSHTRHHTSIPSILYISASPIIITRPCIGSNYVTMLAECRKNIITSAHFGKKIEES